MLWVSRLTCKHATQTEGKEGRKTHGVAIELVSGVAGCGCWKAFGFLEQLQPRAKLLASRPECQNLGLPSRKQRWLSVQVHQVSQRATSSYFSVDLGSVNHSQWVGWKWSKQSKRNCPSVGKFQKVKKFIFVFVPIMYCVLVGCRMPCCFEESSNAHVKVGVPAAWSWYRYCTKKFKIPAWQGVTGMP